jgi:F0F1-type ATP synthase assembly protein I
MIILYKPILLIVAAFLWIVVVFGSFFLPNSKLWISILCGILCGLCMGVYMSGFPLGLITGIIIGLIIDVVIIPSGLLNKYYQKKGLEHLQKYKDRTDKDL